MDNGKLELSEILGTLADASAPSVTVFLEQAVSYVEDEPTTDTDTEIISDDLPEDNTEG
jgi:hypothetical protein